VPSIAQADSTEIRDLFISEPILTNHNTVMAGLTNHECLPSEFYTAAKQKNLLPKMKISKPDAPKMISKLYEC